MTDKTGKQKDKATAHGAPRDESMKVRAHPPTLFYSSCLATVVLGSWNGSRFPIVPQQRHHYGITAMGLGGFMACVGFAMTAIKTFQRRKTPVPHGYQVQTIVREGVFGVTRNPMYLSMVAGVASLGVALNSWWGGVFALGLAGTLHYLVIPHEEAYLTQTFGKRYQDYKTQVPRWILFI